jgi:hypothetical protein
MPAFLRFLWIAPFVALSTAALGQATGGIGAGTSRLPGGATSSIGLPTVPNNSLPPLPGSSTSELGATATTPSLTPTTPAFTAPIPGLGTTTTSPQATTPGVIIQLPPPSPGLSSSPGATRTCPSGMTFC